MDLTFDLENLISFVNGLGATLDFDIAGIFEAIGSGSGSLGGAPVVPDVPAQ